MKRDADRVAMTLVTLVAAGGCGRTITTIGSQETGSAAGGSGGAGARGGSGGASAGAGGFGAVVDSGLDAPGGCEDDAGAPVAEAHTVAVGSRHTCAVVDGGRVKCWGANFARQLGRGTESPREPLAEFAVVDAVAQIAAGRTTTLRAPLERRRHLLGGRAHPPPASAPLPTRRRSALLRARVAASLLAMSTRVWLSDAAAFGVGVSTTTASLVTATREASSRRRHRPSTCSRGAEF